MSDIKRQAIERGWKPNPKRSEQQQLHDARQFLQQGVTPPRDILIVGGLLFFALRDAAGKPTYQLSQKTLDEVTTMFRQIFVFYTIDHAKLIEALTDYPNMRLFAIDKLRVKECMEAAVDELNKQGVHFRPFPPNRREVSWLNLNRWINDPKVSFVLSDEHAKLGLEPEKEETFKDAAGSRRDAAEW